MTTRFRRAALTTLVCAWAMIGAQVAHAQSTYQFDLPAQSLADALRAVGHQTGTNILFDTKTLSSIRAPALKGNLSTADAMERLLSGTGLTAQRNADNTVLVRAERKGESGQMDQI